MFGSLKRSLNVFILVLMITSSSYHFSFPTDDGDTFYNGKIRRVDLDIDTSQESTRAELSQILLTETFESNSFATNGWAKEDGSGGVEIVTTNPKNGTRHLHFKGNSYNTHGYISKVLNLSAYSQAVLEFEAYGGPSSGGGIDGPGGSEDILWVDFRSSATSQWTTLNYWHGANCSLNQYRFERVTLPSSSFTNTSAIRFRNKISVNSEYYRIDDIKVKAAPQLEINTDNIAATPSSILRYNGTINISGSFTDDVGFGILDYKISIGIRDPEGKETLLIDNKTSGNDSLNIQQQSPGEFNFFYIWSPSENFLFGKYDINIKVYHRLGWKCLLSYDDNDCNFTLLSVAPYFRNESIFFEKEPLNALDPDGIPITIKFHDVDRQSPDDFFMNLTLRGTENNITIFKSATNVSGLNISMTENGTYEAAHVWYPENPDDLVEGRYSVDLGLWEEGGPLVEMEIFNIERNVTLVKRYVPGIISLACQPDTINMSGSGKTTIQGEFFDKDTSSMMDFEISLKIRDGDDKEIILTDGAKSGENGVIIEKSGIFRWRITFAYDPPVTLRPGPYDLYMDVFDGESTLTSEGFNNNTDELFIYNNTSPIIHEITLSRSVVNKYGNDSARLSIIFSDPDGESMGNFTINLTLIDSEGNLYTLVNGEKEGPNASISYLAPIDGHSYVFTFDIDPDTSFTEGPYGLSFNVRDKWGGIDGLAYGENDLNLTFFYNYIPSPPSKIWPNSTTDKLPLISWWGALDLETPHEELEYSIRIGTAGVDDNILAWHDVGQRTTYQVMEELEVGFYHIQVKSYDGDFYSEVSSSIMTIAPDGNHPPGVPGAISPLYTVRRDPTITWDASIDRDVNDLIEYFISIGTDWHASDIIKSTPTSVNTIYQLPFMLSYGTYYVQVMATDGYEFSPVREQRMIIFDPSDNIAPFPPKSIMPDVTRNPYPLIQWEGAVDLNGDDLLFWFRIGSGPGQGDIIPWSSTGKSNYFQIEKSMAPGDYYVQVKCYDSQAFSRIFEAVIRVKTEREIIGPTEIIPRISSDPTPLINWSGAHYMNSPGTNENFSYLIRLSSEPSLGDLLPWSLVSNTTSYQVEKPLRRGDTVYVEIKAFDGHQYSEVSIFDLWIGDFSLTVGFNETNYIYKITGEANQTIRGFIKNSGRDDVTVELGLGGTFAKYVKVPAEPLHIKSGEMVSVLLTVNIPDSANVNRDSVIVLIATSTDGAAAQSELLGFAREKAEDETWSEALGMNLNLILGSIVLLLAFFILLILIVKRSKRGKRERFEVMEVSKSSEAVVIDDLVQTSIYSTQRLSDRRTFEALDKTLLKMFKAHGVRTKSRVKGQKGRALGDGSKGKKTPALPPPSPGALEPGEVKKMPPPPGERVEFLPPGEDVPAEELPPAPEMEYIPPEGSGKTPVAIGDAIVDAEEITEKILESDEISEQPEADAVAVSLEDDENVDEMPEGFAETPEDVSVAVEGDGEEPLYDLSEDAGSLRPTGDDDDSELSEVLSQDMDEDSGISDAVTDEPNKGDPAEPDEPLESAEPDESHPEESVIQPDSPIGAEPSGEVAPEPRSESPEPVEQPKEPETPPSEADMSVPSEGDRPTTDDPTPPKSLEEAPEAEKEDSATDVGDDSSALDDIMDILGIDEDE